ncbi:MAG: hypothetical protein Fur007_04980 [Rhodoferax sp.]
MLRLVQRVLAVIGLVWLVWLATWPGQATAEDASITPQLSLSRSDEAVWLSAQLPLELPTAVALALQKGIALHFVVQARVVQPRWYWSDKVLASAVRRVRLDYLPLTNIWRVTWLDPDADPSPGLGLTRQFGSPAEALASLRRIFRWRIAEAAALDPAQTYTVRLEFALDVTQLPRPLQIGALGQADWQLAMRAEQPLEPLKP